MSLHGSDQLVVVSFGYDMKPRLINKIVKQATDHFCTQQNGYAVQVLGKGMYYSEGRPGTYPAVMLSVWKPTAEGVEMPVSVDRLYRYLDEISVSYNPIWRFILRHETVGLSPAGFTIGLDQHQSTVIMRARAQYERLNAPAKEHAVSGG